MFLPSTTPVHVTVKDFPSPVVTSEDHVALTWAEEPDFTAWSPLLASIPPSERRNSQVRRSHVVISIPVCTVGKVSVTG